MLVPLWSSYLVKVYAWRTILSEDGVLNWVLDPLGLSGPGYGNARRLAGDELHLAAVHDHPDLRRARADPELGAERLRGPRREAWHTFRRVIWPLVFPAIVAGSIFTFSLTLGDFITPPLVSSTQFIGNVVYVEHHHQPAARGGLSRRCRS